jgi:hypothetical protein
LNVAVPVPSGTRELIKSQNGKLYKHANPSFGTTGDYPGLAMKVINDIGDGVPKNVLILDNLAMKNRRWHSRLAGPG